MVSASMPSQVFGETFSRAASNCAEVGGMNPNLCYCLLYYYILNASMDEDTLQTDICIHSYIHLPQKQVMFLLCAIALALLFQTQPYHPFFHSGQPPVCFFIWPASHHCFEFAFPWIFRANE